jgi:hypothetical protein
MKKKNLKKLAILGLTSGLIISSQAAKADPLQDPNHLEPSLSKGRGRNCGGISEIPSLKFDGEAALAFSLSSKKVAANENSGKDSSKDSSSSTSTSDADANAQNMSYHLWSEKELLEQLNDEGVKLYNSLDSEGKLMARKVASNMCNGTNECSGLNACKTDKNDCAGKGTCKGTGKCALADKNLAVKLVVKKMAAKRANATQSP